MSVIYALDYSRYPRGNTAPTVLPRGNTAPTVLPQMHYRYRGSTIHSVPSPRYYREIIPIPTVITAVTAFPITVPFSSGQLFIETHPRAIIWDHTVLPARLPADTGKTGKQPGRLIHKLPTPEGRRTLDTLLLLDGHSEERPISAQPHLWGWYRNGPG